MQLLQLFLMSGLRSCHREFILEKVNILVDMKEKASLAGIEKIMKEPLNWLMGQILKPTKLLIQITIVVCCLGNCYIFPLMLSMFYPKQCIICHDGHVKLLDLHFEMWKKTEFCLIRPCCFWFHEFIGELILNILSVRYFHLKSLCSVCI